MIVNQKTLHQRPYDVDFSICVAIQPSTIRKPHTALQSIKPLNERFKLIQMRKQTVLFIYKTNNNYDIQQQATTTELQSKSKPQIRYLQFSSIFENWYPCK